MRCIDFTLKSEELNVKPKLIEFHMSTPILVVLFHKGICRTSRYGPLSFLLSYGVQNPLPALFRQLNLNSEHEKLLRLGLSPLDYICNFKDFVGDQNLKKIKEIGKKAQVSRLPLISELCFSDVIRQRLAKKMVTSGVIIFIWNRLIRKSDASHIHKPLSFLFLGPSGNGKTELARWVAKLLNKPNEDAFIKVDCGKLSDAHELFGMSGAYQGAENGSALNNFILRMSGKKQALGVVLLDEIEKAKSNVIHGLYQVLDKGEWTNEKLTKGSGAQTESIPCHNIIFIMTSNAADHKILEFTSQNKDIYSSSGSVLNSRANQLQSQLRSSLKQTVPFTSASIGRIDSVVPFLPMANGDSEKCILQGEVVTVAKVLIERSQKLLDTNESIDVFTIMTPSVKESIARIEAAEHEVDEGVRSIERAVDDKVKKQVMASMLEAKGGVKEGSLVQFFASVHENNVDFRVENTSARVREQDMESGSEDGYVFD
mmetsp:Transcript_10167/g.25511  ORF Transcript_10167/g.25511 Transcript_10167/m.25511 type:complete len:485 (+) Transcript_10167:807-2261(+)